MFEPSVNQISSAYLGNPGALQNKVQQEQKASPNLPPDLRDLLALQDIQQQKAAFQRQQAMSQPQPPTVAEQLMQAVQQPAQPAPQGMPQGMQPGMPQGAPQGMPQGAPQGMQPMPQGIAQVRPQGIPQAPQGMQRPGIQQLPSNVGQHLAGGGIVAFAAGEDVERDALRRLEAAYDPAVTEALNNANTVPMASSMPAEDIQRARAIMSRNMSQNPEQAEAELIRKHQAQVGNQDLSAYDRLMAEYETRKKQLEAPKPGMDALLEYLSQVAAAPRGRTWMESGAAGARAQNDLNAQRQAQQFELTKQGLELGQKKADLMYGQKEKLFGLGRAAYDQAYKANYETALKVTGNAFEAEKLAKELTEKQLDRASNEKMASDRNKLTADANANHAAYHQEHLKLMGRQQDLAELTKPTADDVNFNRIMGKVNQDPEIKGLAKRLENDEPGSETYRQTQKLMHEKMSTYFSRHPDLLPPLAKMSDVAEPLAKDKSFAEGFKAMGEWGWYPGKTSAAKPAGTVSFDQLPK